MALRNVLIEGDPILKTKCRKVEKFDDRLAQLLDDMAETMYFSKGVGLAACQVGIIKRALVIDVGDGLIELVNPEIVEQSGEQREKEGCLSCPGEYGTTLRPMIVKVKAFDRKGKPVEVSGKGLKARALCHEIDHLDGILFKSRVISGEVNLRKK